MLDSLMGEFDVGTKLGDIQFEAYEGQEDVKSIFDLVISWWYAVEAKNFTIFKSFFPFYGNPVSVKTYITILHHENAGRSIFSHISLR